MDFFFRSFCIQKALIAGDAVSLLSSATHTASTTVSAAEGLPVLRGVIELDQPRIELLYQDSDDVHEEHKIDLLIEKEECQIKKKMFSFNGIKLCTKCHLQHGDY